ncbi:hypothetical protein GLOIN_2v1849173 [Rhizophagus irregularis DAOM 181602=DAOM 197198]|nr:hypothetical protein GLOIN_2v1849173 [Rhizophagus irregularis DAOM 181602=DAOM 197198]
MTSLYPSIQQSNANFPIQQGKFQILKDFVDHRGYALYGLFRAKRVLNTLWGALCQRKRNYKTLTTDQTDPFKFPEGHTLDSIIPVGSDQWRFQFTNPDGFILEEQPSSPTLITSPENAFKALKALKFETAGYCHVKNANKVIWT